MFRVGDKFKNYYDMQNADYRNFMLLIVQNLEPQHWLKGSVMINELDEAGQIIFV